MFTSIFGSLDFTSELLIKACTLDLGGSERVKDNAAAWRMEGSVFLRIVSSSVQRRAVPG